jgi:NCAIR mutase (PurE)-related protein
MMDIKEILEKLKLNQITVEEAQKLLEQPMDYATIDYDRKRRTGVPEVIYGKGKTVQQIKGIVENMLSHHQTDILITRVDEEKYQELKQFFPRFIYDEMSKIFYCGGEKSLNKGKIAVICAGTSDLPVANEAAITARFLGNEVIQINDVGVAGLHRLLHRIDDIQQAQVIVVVAGMEGALASVVGGLVSSPIIAVPTSVGYGANFQGLSALLSMLNSCASGVSVVNIDNGFGAGYMAHSINCIGGKR